MKPFLLQQLERYVDRLGELDFLLSREDIMADMAQFMKLSREHAEVAVVAKADAMLDSVPVAFVLRKPGAPAEEAMRKAILARCEQSLAKFKRPREVRFVDDFPRATLNKIAKARLREMLDAEGSSRK